MEEELLSEYLIRHSQKQKHGFLEEMKGQFEEMGYEAKVEKVRTLGIPNYNLVIGDIEKANYICTAHFDTPNTILGGVAIYPKHFWLSLWAQLKIVVIGLIPYWLLYPYSPSISYWIFLGIILLMSMTFTNKKNYNDNTSGVMTVYKIAQQLAKQKSNQVAFVLFDNEEKGLLGSMGFARQYKKIIHEKMIINFDCVGDGEYILIGGTKGTLPVAERICGCKKQEWTCNIETHLKKNILLMSDDQNFKRAIQVMAFEKDKKGRLILRNIHSNKDEALSFENIEVITNLMTDFIQQEMAAK